MAGQRRSRFRRTPVGKRVFLTLRDIEIFRTLSRYRYLRSTYLHAFAGGASEKRFKERLGDLFHEGFIDRPEKQWECADGRFAPVVYELGDRVKRVLSENEQGGAWATTFLSSNAHRQFLHSLLICECLASMELAALARSDIRFITWPEILARAPECTRDSRIPFRIPTAAVAVIPDGLFGLEYHRDGKRSYRFFALEIDRGTMPVVRADATKTSYLAKLAAYQEIIASNLCKTHWGIPNLFVLTITTSQERMDTILQKFGERGGEPLFLFKSMDVRAVRFPAPNLLADSWARPGERPLSIGVP